MKALKELSIEEKAKCYEEAIKRAKSKIKNDKDHVLYEDDVIEIFPELKESRVEKPNGGIVSEDFNEDDGFYKVNLAYLSKEQVEEIESFVEKWNLELKESEDERIRKELIKLLRNLFNNYSYFIKDPFYTECIAWLEKQDEKKIIWHNKDEEPCEDRQILICLSGNYYVDFYHKEDKRFYMFYKPKHYLHEIEKWAYIDDLLERKNDNADKVEPKDYNIDPHFGKPINKVEPKFHEGDWVVTDKGDTVQIGTVNNDYYIIGNGMLFSMPYVDTSWHLWTIKDVKAGDVLANDHNILILKESVYDWYTNGTPYSVKAYCGIKPNGNFEIGIDNWSFCGTLHIHPATKEQRDILFQKMKEEGYVWNEDKKELIKL